eukprot:8054_1
MLPLDLARDCEFKWFAKNGNILSGRMQCEINELTEEQRKTLDDNSDEDSVYVESWNDYFYEAYKGAIAIHFESLSLISNKPISSLSNCVHNQYKNIQECIDKMFKLFTEPCDHPPIDWNLYEKVKNNGLCYDCILHVCSNKIEFEALFDEYVKHYTNWKCISTLSNYERFSFLSICLLTYQPSIKYILLNEKLYTKIFTIFIHFLQNFQTIKHHMENNSLYKQFRSFLPEGYTLCDGSIYAFWSFEYAFCRILGCFRKLMPYFKLTHLCCLINMDYFEHCIKFSAEYFGTTIPVFSLSESTEHELNINGCAAVQMGGLTYVTALYMSVVNFLNCRINAKISGDNVHLSIWNKIRNAKLKHTVNFHLDSINQTIYVPFDLSKYGEFVKHCQLLSVQGLLHGKAKQLREHVICGNLRCNDKNGKFKLCAQCQLVYYCSRKCQKIDWTHHKYFCRLLIE